MNYQKGLIVGVTCAFVLTSSALANPQQRTQQPRRTDTQKTDLLRRQPKETNNRWQSQQTVNKQQGGQARSRRDIVRTPDFVLRSKDNRVQKDGRRMARFMPPQKPVQVIIPRRGQYETRAQEIRPERRPDQKRPPIDRRPQEPPTLQRPSRPPINVPRIVHTPDRVAQRNFTKNIFGRRYDNGLTLRDGKIGRDRWHRRYFRLGHYHYPFYRERYVRNQTYISLYGFFYDVCAPYISVSTCRYYPPSVTFINVPIYSGSTFRGFEDWGDQNHLDDPGLDDREPGLVNALDEITEAFREGNIDALAPLMDPSTMIAVYERGDYKYSLTPNDYLDLTRDALNSLDTVNFQLDYLHKDAPGIYSASGRHEYRDRNGRPQTNHVSFVLESISGEWTLTQVEVAPGSYRDLTRYVD